MNFKYYLDKYDAYVNRAHDLRQAICQLRRESEHDLLDDPIWIMEAKKDERASVTLLLNEYLNVSDSIKDMERCEINALDILGNI